MYANSQRRSIESSARQYQSNPSDRESLLSYQRASLFKERNIVEDESDTEMAKSQLENPSDEYVIKRDLRETELNLKRMIESKFIMLEASMEGKMSGLLKKSYSNSKLKEPSEASIAYILREVEKRQQSNERSSMAEVKRRVETEIRSLKDWIKEELKTPNQARIYVEPIEEKAIKKKYKGPDLGCEDEIRLQDMAMEGEARVREIMNKSESILKEISLKCDKLMKEITNSNDYQLKQVISKYEAQLKEITKDNELNIKKSSTRVNLQKGAANKGNDERLVEEVETLKKRVEANEVQLKSLMHDKKDAEKDTSACKKQLSEFKLGIKKEVVEKSSKHETMDEGTIRAEIEEIGKRLNAELEWVKKKLENNESLLEEMMQSNDKGDRSEQSASSMSIRSEVPQTVPLKEDSKKDQHKPTKGPIIRIKKLTEEKATKKEDSSKLKSEFEDAIKENNKIKVALEKMEQQHNEDIEKLNVKLDKYRTKSAECTEMCNNKIGEIVAKENSLIESMSSKVDQQLDEIEEKVENNARSCLNNTKELQNVLEEQIREISKSNGEQNSRVITETEERFNELLKNVETTISKHDRKNEKLNEREKVLVQSLKTGIEENANAIRKIENTVLEQKTQIENAIIKEINDSEDETRKVIEELKNDMKELQQKVNDNSIAENLEELNSKIEYCEKQVNNLSSKDVNQPKKDTVEAMQTQMNEMGKQIKKYEQINTKIDRLEEEIITTKTYIKNTINENTLNCTNSLANAHNTIKQCQNKLDNLSKEIEDRFGVDSIKERLTVNEKNLEEFIEGNKDTVEDFEKRIADNENEIEKLVIQKSEDTDNIFALKNSINKLGEELNKTKTESEKHLKTNEEKLTELVKECNTKANAVKYSADIKDIRKKLEDNDLQLDEVLKNNDAREDDFSNRVDEVKSAIVEVKDNVVKNEEKVNAEIQILRRKLEEMANDNKLQISAINKLLMNSLEKANSKTETERLEIRERIEALNTQLAEAKKQSKKFAEDLESKIDRQIRETQETSDKLIIENSKKVVTEEDSKEQIHALEALKKRLYDSEAESMERGKRLQETFATEMQKINETVTDHIKAIQFSTEKKIERINEKLEECKAQGKLLEALEERLSKNESKLNELSNTSVENKETFNNYIESLKDHINANEDEFVKVVEPLKEKLNSYVSKVDEIARNSAKLDEIQNKLKEFTQEIKIANIDTEVQLKEFRLKVENTLQEEKDGAKNTLGSMRANLKQEFNDTLNTKIVQIQTRIEEIETKLTANSQASCNSAENLHKEIMNIKEQSKKDMDPIICEVNEIKSKMIEITANREMELLKTGIETMNSKYEEIAKTVNNNDTILKEQVKNSIESSQTSTRISALESQCLKAHHSIEDQIRQVDENIPKVKETIMQRMTQLSQQIDEHNNVLLSRMRLMTYNQPLQQARHTKTNSKKSWQSDIEFGRGNSAIMRGRSLKPLEKANKFTSNKKSSAILGDDLLDAESHSLIFDKNLHEKEQFADDDNFILQFLEDSKSESFRKEASLEDAGTKQRICEARETSIDLSGAHKAFDDLSGQRKDSSGA